MRKLLPVLALAVFALASVGCRDPNVPQGDADAQTPGSLDAVGEPTCLRACASLARLGCGEAFPEVGTCEETCERVVDAGKSPFDPTCIAGAKSVEAVRACPAVRCVQ